MICPKCNKYVSDDHLLCLDCGTPLIKDTIEEDSPEQNNEQQVIIDSLFKNNNTNKDVPPAPNGLKNKWVTYLVLSIISCFCCNQIGGIIGIAFAAGANNDYTNGRYDDYKQKINVARWAIIIGAILSIVITIFVVAINIFNFMTVTDFY